MRALPLPLLLALTLLPAAACEGASEATAATPTAQAMPTAQEPAMTDEPAAEKPTLKTPAPVESAVALHPALAEYVASVVAEAAKLPDDRKQKLDALAAFVQERLAAGEPAKLTFICTHNSRRSHISQLWAATAAAYHGLKGVETYSGGTEATAFNPRAVAAMRRAGFEIEDGEGDNPHYQVTFSPEAPAQECFSKKYDDDFNPQKGFAAVMTCTDADKNCPVVFGAALRVGLPYVDPKESDGTPEEAATYDARAKQIATEMFYLFSRVQG